MPKSCVPLTLCQSSNIKAYGYQPDGGILEVQFGSGNSYQYAGVPPELFEEFTKATSLGQFFGQRIRGKFETTKVERDEPEKAETPEAPQ